MLSTSFFSASFLSTTVDDEDCCFNPEANAADMACAWANTLAWTLSGIALTKRQQQALQMHSFD